MLRLLRSSSPLTLLFLIVFTAALGLPWILHPTEITTPWPGFFHGVLSDKMHITLRISGLLCALITMVILCVQGVFISLLAQRYKIVPEAGMIPAVLYISIYVLFAENGIPSVELCMNFILIWMLYRIYALYNRQKADSIYFDTGLMNGIMACMYFPAVVFILFSLYAMVRLKPTSVREIMVWLSGILCVFFLGGTILFWYGRTDMFLDSYFQYRNISTGWGSFLHTRAIAASVITGLILLCSLIFLGLRFSTNLIQVRRYLGASLMFVIFAIAVLLLHSAPVARVVTFSCIGMSLLFGYFLTGLRRRIYAEITFDVCILTAFLFQYVIFA